MWVAKVVVPYKPGILDPEGKAIRNALLSLGFQNIVEIGTGKYFRLSFGDNLSRTEAEELAKQACEKLLANPVIQDYSFHLDEVSE